MESTEQWYKNVAEKLIVNVKNMKKYKNNESVSGDGEKKYGRR